LIHHLCMGCPTPCYRGQKNKRWIDNCKFTWFQEKRTTSQGIPKFSKIFSWKFPLHLIFIPKFPEFSIEWLAFRKFDNFRNLSPFRKFRNFWLNGKRPFRPFSNPWDTSPGPRLFHILHYKSTRFGWNLWFQSCNYLNQEIWRLELNWIPLSLTLNS